MSNLPSFGAAVPQLELQESYQDEISPLGDIRQGPIEFNIIGNDDFIDLSATTLHLTAKITKADGTAYDDKAEVAFTNNVLHSLFSDVIFTINDTIVEGGEMQYSMKSMISTLFTYSSDTVKNQLFAAGYVRDDAGKADDVTNTGYVARKAWTSKGASKEFYGKLALDLFRQNKYMMPNVNMRLKFIKAQHTMAIWTNSGTEKYKVVFEAAKLYLKKIRPHPQILQNIDNNLSRGGLVHYPINRSEIVQIPLAANNLEITKEQLFYGRVPKMIVLAMCDNEALSGVYAKNPYNFGHYNVKHVDLRVDGVSKPILPLTPNFTTKSCIREYMSLLESMAILGKDSCLPFTYEDFLNGYTFFAWNMTADYEGQPQNPGKRANIRLKLKFSETTKTSINILLYCIFDSTVMIDGSGNVFTDYKD